MGERSCGWPLFVLCSSVPCCSLPILLDCTALYCTALYRSPQAITGVSTYNVVPEKAAYYFNKIQCFCFEEQRLRGGEEVDMPVFFYIDPEMVDDFNCRWGFRGARASVLLLQHCCGFGELRTDDLTCRAELICPQPDRQWRM